MELPHIVLASATALAIWVIDGGRPTVPPREHRSTREILHRWGIDAVHCGGDDGTGFLGGFAKCSFAIAC